jgi:hypothetical protein
VERTLHVPQEKHNNWRSNDSGGNGNGGENQETEGDEYVRYYVARHHFTEALMNQYLADRRAWDWNEPLSLKQAKTFLWSLDRHDIYKDAAAASDSI